MGWGLSADGLVQGLARACAAQQQEPLDDDLNPRKQPPPPSLQLIPKTVLTTPEEGEVDVNHVPLNPSNPPNPELQIP